MKNKHLLLIFASTLLLGLLARYSPWFKNDVFQRDLVRLDSTKIERISITHAGQAELLLEHSDEGWVASQDDFAVRTADSLVAPILTVLAAIRSRRIVQTTQRDTLSLLPSQAVHVEVFMKNGAKERFEIGKEIWEDNLAATYIEIDRHDGIYLIDKHLRAIFAKKIDEFRNKVVLDFLPENLKTLQIFRLNADTLYFQKSDSAGLWQCNNVATKLPQEQVQRWLQWLQQLKGLPFATHTEERMAADGWQATLELGMPDAAESISLQFFALGGYKPSDKRMGTTCLLQSSQNPFSFFALSDTALVRNILSGPATAND